MNTERERTGWRLAPGWMKLLLIVSLSVNIGIAGLIGGAKFHLWKYGPYAGRWKNEPGLDRRQSRILRMVPDKRREEARVILLSRQEEYRAAREAMRAAQQSLIEAIRREPLDQGNLNAALAERRAASGRVWGIGYEQMIEIAVRLDAAERSEMARLLEERTRRWMARQDQRGQ